MDRKGCPTWGFMAKRQTSLLSLSNSEKIKNLTSGHMNISKLRKVKQVKGVNKVCQYCDDKNIGIPVILEFSEKELAENIIVSLDYWLYRGFDKTAKIEGEVTICEHDFLSVDLKINYCPMCGRKLSED